MIVNHYNNPDFNRYSLSSFFLQQMEHLKAFIKDCDRKIVLAKKRLSETQDDFDNTSEVKHSYECHHKFLSYFSQRNGKWTLCVYITCCKFFQTPSHVCIRLCKNGQTFSIP